MRSYIPDGAVLVPGNAKRVFEGVIYDVYQWQQEMFDGSRATFEMLKRPDTVQAIAIVEGKIVYIEEEQPGHRSFASLPGGRHDIENETELDAVKREMREETGMSFKNWKLVKCDQLHTKLDWFIYLFVASDLVDQAETQHDSGEKITIKKASLDEIKQIAFDQEKRQFPLDFLNQFNSTEELSLAEELR